MTNLVIIKEILKSSVSWNGSPLPGLSSGQTEFRVVIYKMAPGAKTTVHMHPINSAGYIISGELTLYATEDPHGSFEDPKQIKKVKLKSGDAWTETVNTWHYGENQGNEESEFVMIFVGQEDTHSTLSLGTHPK